MRSPVLLVLAACLALAACNHAPPYRQPEIDGESGDGAEKGDLGGRHVHTPDRCDVAVIQDSLT